VTLFVEGRYSANSTSDIREAAVKQYVKTAVDTTRHLAKDPHRHLPDPERYEGMVTEDLEIFDPAVPNTTPESRLVAAKALEAAARDAGKKSDIVSVTSEVSDYEYRSVCLNTNGLEVGEQGTSTWYACSVSVKDSDDRKPRGSAYGGGTFQSDLPDTGIIGADAVARAVSQIGARQVATDRYAVLIENRAAPSLSRHLLSPLSGSALQQQRSFMEGKLGEKVGADILSLRSEPHLKRGLASTAWDTEGMATRPFSVFDKGILKTYFLDTYYASKLGMAPTSGSATNLVWQSGDRKKDEIVKATKKGILVTSFLGGNSNATTGDFSLGIKGFYIENGELKHPVSEMNIAGNHLTLWNDLKEVGADPWPYSSNRAPTLRFANVQCSGSKG
jgi:PmbA protein